MSNHPIKALQGYRDWNDVGGDRAAFLALMSQLCSMYKGQQAAALNKSDLELWFVDLNAWPLDDIVDVMTDWRRENDFMPRVSNIRRLLKVVGKQKGYIYDHAAGKYAERPLLTAQEQEKSPVPPPREFSDALEQMKALMSPGRSRVEWTDEHRRLEEELDRREGKYD